ncbi:hypothetical protein [Pseudomonas aeruginosa]|nr:hypothetical protein [Pseudomonas aeruginosa]MCT9629239.1 hypothetical protein [Pseudomonas aeruginosa]MCW8036555.1 hypothetical protein [Pseudomonas aeruginosa]
MGGTAGRPKWLRNDGGEWEWVYKYMRQATDLGIKTSFRHATRGRAPSYEMVADAIAYLQETRDGLEFVTRLRNALRQHRHRSVNSEKNRKPYSFTLPVETKKAISVQAKKLKMSGEELVADLLGGAEKSLEEHRKREQALQDALTNERKRRTQLDERWKVKHDEAIRQIERLATLLTMWELTLEQTDPGFDGDEARLQSETKKKVSGVKKAITDALKMHELLEARLI